MTLPIFGEGAAPTFSQCPAARSDWKDVTYLGRGAMELQKPIFKPLHFGLELFSFPVQQALVESDELQK